MSKIANPIDNFDEDEDDDDQNYEDIDDEVVENVKILSLFEENKWFDDIKSLYRYEMDTNGFNLVKIVKKFQLDMLSYIKMINFIRKTVNRSFDSLHLNQLIFFRNLQLVSLILTIKKFPGVVMIISKLLLKMTLFYNLVSLY
jgi:hypothetical protein